MIKDSRSASAPGNYDLLIVGAGAAGITLANEFDGTGLRVALLESGGEEFDPVTQELYNGEVTGLDEIDLTACRLRLLGGTTNHWGGRCVPLDPIDFSRAPFSGLTGWPFPRREIEPYYVRANEYCGVGQFNYDPEQATGLSADDFLLPEHSAVVPAVVRQSSVNFGEKYHDMLSRSQNVELWLWANLTGLDFDGDGNVTNVRIQSLSRQEQDFHAPLVILACGAVENARILMLANRQSGSRYGDAGGLLGAGYMDHPAGGAAFLHSTGQIGVSPHWDKDLTAKGDDTPLWLLWRLRDEVLDREGLANGQFYLLPFRDSTHAETEREAKRGMGGLRNIAKWAVGRSNFDFRLSDSYCEFINNADSMAATMLRGGWGSAPIEKVLLKYETEQQPTRDNRVTLGKETDVFGRALPILNWSPGEFDRESLIRTTVLVGKACGQAGIGRLEMEPHLEERYFGSTTSWHQIGTTRMSVAPADGVTDPDGRVHGTRNLFIAGGSVMPTAGRANPTLTIVALAVRLADHVKKRQEG